jgi:hypothetical protein
MSADLSPAWREAVERHSAAVRAYVEAASRVDEASWREPVGPDKWSPAEITEHVTRAYEVLVTQIGGGAGLRVRTGWVVRQALRLTVLRAIMRSRRIPRGAKAPSELRPVAPDSPRDAAIEALGAAASRFEAALLERRGDPSLRLTHHFFGDIEPLEGLDFVAIHTEHRGRQLPSARA